MKDHRHGRLFAAPAVWWLLLLLYAPPCPAGTQPHPVLLLLSADTTPYQELSLALEASLGPEDRRRLRLTVQHLGDPLPRDQTLIITAGLKALRGALKEDSGPPILATLIPRVSYQRIVANRSRTTSALYIDQPPERYLHLLRAVLPEARRVAFLAGPHGRPLLPHLKQAAARMGLKLDTAPVDGPRELSHALRRLFPNSDALLALADPAVYNRYTLKNILLATYRHGLPVIAYSRSFVRAGALAAVYTTPAQLGLQLAETLAAWLERPHHALPPPRYPDYFVVDVNRPLAQALGLRIPHDAVLMDRLRRFQGVAR